MVLSSSEKRIVRISFNFRFVICNCLMFCKSFKFCEFIFFICGIRIRKFILKKYCKDYRMYLNYFVYNRFIKMVVVIIIISNFNNNNCNYDKNIIM